MRAHWRTGVYLVAAAAIWFAEDYVFTRGLGFDGVQTGIVTIYFVLLFATAIAFILRATRRMRNDPSSAQGEFSATRLLSMAPAMTVIIGSFAALPILILVLALGSVL